MGDGFSRDHAIALGRLPLIKPLHLRTKTHGKLRCFHRGPLKIRIAIFDIPLTFTLPIADFRTLDTTAVRGIVPSWRKASHLTRFQDDRLGQNLSDTIDASQLLGSGRVFQMLLDGVFERFDLLAQAFQEPQGARNRQDLGGFGEQALKVFLP